MFIDAEAKSNLINGGPDHLVITAEIDQAINDWVAFLCDWIKNDRRSMVVPFSDDQIHHMTVAMCKHRYRETLEYLMRDFGMMSIGGKREECFV